MGRELTLNTFQSTLSMRRATARQTRRTWPEPPISIHALHEESDIRLGPSVARRTISIHALHEESDWFGDAADGLAVLISIHALHEESD